jgi:hypothetical protein
MQLMGEKNFVALFADFRDISLAGMHHALQLNSLANAEK